MPSFYNPVIPIIVGPTAIGKTYLGIQLALKMEGEIISADSMQVYKYMNIGTAKPDLNEKNGITHHLIDFVSPEDRFTVADFQEMALKKIEDLLAQNTLPIIVGGTGLYIHSLLYDMDFTEQEIDVDLRSQLEKIYQNEGSHVLFQKLKKLDPEVALRIHPNNWKRIIRAIEVCSNTKEGIKDFSKDLKLRKNFSFKVYGLYQDRDLLYESINHRVDNMIQQGLEKEVEFLLNSGFNPNLPAMKGVGYKELISYLNGEYGYERAVELIKRNTRRFAKRQMTWFKRTPNVTWFQLHKSDPEEKKAEIVKISRHITNELEGMVDNEKQC
ncbi:MAG: tRNA (adenosine(37)-N6)-dimethylallyltransferase MiaA [Tindallia sp. MSAO_Bac2]|nr:MAG: tRNA (adenosine(37)-N6)-dimethylallyltransferase MiaA [Tindallia sp. MSAO_Bac2]